MPPSIRPATLRDAALIAEIHNESLATKTASMETGPKTASGVRAWLEHLGDREQVLVAEIDGVMAGWGVIKKYSDRHGYRFTGETSVFLRRDLRRQGVGTFLKTAVIERARELGYHHLIARIIASNERSISYNLRLGYQLVGIQREAGFLDGAWRDIAVLQLLLDVSSTSDPSTP